MTRPDAVRPGKRWTCRCGRTIGFITSADDLVITASGTTIERAVLAVVVRCECGQTRVYTGRSVRINVPVKEAA